MKTTRHAFTGSARHPRIPQDDPRHFQAASVNPRPYHLIAILIVHSRYYGTDTKTPKDLSIGTLGTLSILLIAWL